MLDTSSIRALRCFIYSHASLPLESFLLEFASSFKKSAPAFDIQPLIAKKNISYRLGKEGSKTLPNSLPALHRQLKPMQNVSHFPERQFRLYPQLTSLFENEKLPLSTNAFVLGFPLIGSPTLRIWFLIAAADPSYFPARVVTRLQRLFDTLAEMLWQQEHFHLLDKSELLSRQEEAISHLGHQLKSPLHQLTALLEEGDSIPEEGLKLVRKTSVQINAYLDYCKLCRISLSRLPLSTLLQDTKLYFNSAARNLAHSFAVNCEKEILNCSVYGHRIFAAQVLANLVDNAVRAMKGKGEIILSAKLLEKSRFIELSFQDTGPGIPLHIGGQLFSPFVSNSPGGHGLGLCLCKRVMDLHGGGIEWDREFKRGTRFKLRFILY